MYAKIVDGEVDTFPYFKGMLKSDFPNTSFPKVVSDDLLESYGIYRVVHGEQPSFDLKTQDIAPSDTPILIDGVWTIVWSVTDKTAEEIQSQIENVSEDKRRDRDALLAETDWWASSDLTMTAEQTAYRQALRDITIHANWPYLEEADWPTKP